jgi:hypothetical protein
MKIKYREMTCRFAKPLSFAVLILAVLYNPNSVSLYAMSFTLNEFVEIDKGRADNLVPGLIRDYPTARFLLFGFAQLNLVRIQQANACDGDFCPTVILHHKADWKIIVDASSEITGETNNDHGGFVSLVLKSKKGQIIVRYLNDDKLIYIIR